MDAFVIKTKREKPEKTKKHGKKKKLTQVTIQALPRVVVVEEIERLAVILQNSTDVNALRNALEELKKTKPSKEILLKTKIGHEINKLRKHEDSVLRNLARDVFKDWKKFYRDQRYRPPIEVRCDAKTELTRMKARKLIADSLGVQVTDSRAEMLERDTFKDSYKRIDKHYKRRIRKLIFDLRSKDTQETFVNENKIYIKNDVDST